MIYDNIVIGSGISALGCVVGLLEENNKQNIASQYLIISNKIRNRSFDFFLLDAKHN